MISGGTKGFIANPAPGRGVGVFYSSSSVSITWATQAHSFGERELGAIIDDI